MKTAAQRSGSLYVRINPTTKKEAEELFGQFGITVSDAVNIFLNKAIIEGGLPFEVKQRRYNAETEAAMEESRQIIEDIKAGKRKPYDNVEDMLRDLKAGV